MAPSPRVVFLGSDAIALPLLRWLRHGAGRADLVAVYTQPDRPLGRGQKVQPNAIKLWAIGEGVPVYQPEKLTGEVRSSYSELRPDLALVMAYGHILKEDFIATPRLGTVNFHASLLPSYRGASPIQTAVAEGERETGVSLMRIVRRLDAGPVADRERISIGPMDTASAVEARLSEACVPLLERNWRALVGGVLRFEEQDEGGASYCRRLVKEDAAIDWALPAARVTARINGLNLWPGAQFVLNDQVIKVGLSLASPEIQGPPGCVLGADGEALVVACGVGAVRLLRLQRPGGKMLPAADFLRGCPMRTGTILPSGHSTVLVSKTPFPKF